MARLTIRIDLDENAAFGPGKARLLETLDRMRSIRSASAALNMSYRRAWLLVRDIEVTIGGPVVIRKTGGARGGGVALTDLGRTVLRRYRAIERSAGNAASGQLRALAKLCGRTPHPHTNRFKRSIRRH
jgi:molybdate transport system regulatory protein